MHSTDHGPDPYFLIEPTWDPVSERFFYIARNDLNVVRWEKHGLRPEMLEDTPESYALLCQNIDDAAKKSLDEYRARNTTEN